MYKNKSSEKYFTVIKKQLYSLDINNKNTKNASDSKISSVSIFYQQFTLLTVAELCEGYWYGMWRLLIWNVKVIDVEC